MENGNRLLEADLCGQCRLDVRESSLRIEDAMVARDHFVKEPGLCRQVVFNDSLAGDPTQSRDYYGGRSYFTRRQ